jgi:hypothetical protein
MTQLNQYSNRFRNGAIALVLASTAALGACGTPDEPVAEEPVAETDVAVEEPAEIAEESNVALGELTGDVEDYLGQTVSVRGEAEAALDESSFLLQDDQLFGGQEVIAFNATGAPIALPADEPTEDVQVTGEVRQLVVAELEQEYGLDLDPELYAEYEDRPAIIAESIAFSPDPEEVTEEPGQYYGQTIAVGGEVGEMLSPGIFRLEEEGWFEGDEVLVIGASTLPTLDEAEEVVVTGTLRPFVAAEFDQEYDLTWDLDLQEQLEAEYTEQPVLVADDVYVSAQ